MKIPTEDVVMHYYLAKNKMRRTCMVKCLNLKNGENSVNEKETECLTNCSTRMFEFLNIAKQIYATEYKSG